MEGNHVPVGVRVVFQRLLQKCLVLGNGQVRGVQSHKQYAAIGKVVIAVFGSHCTVVRGVREGEVIRIELGVVAVIVVAHCSSQCHGAQALRSKEAAILGLHLIHVGAVRRIVFVDLVAHGEQEAVVGAILLDFIYGLGPALDVGIQALGIQLRVANCCKAKGFAKGAGVICVLLGSLLPALDGVGVVRLLGQTGDLGAMDIVTLLIHCGNRCLILFAAEGQGLVSVGLIVPGHGDSVLCGADVHHKILYIQFLAFRFLVQGEGIHHALVAGAIGGYGEGVRSYGNLGVVGNFLLILHCGIGEGFVGNVIELGAGAGVQGHILHAVRCVDISQRSTVRILLHIGSHAVLAAHDVASGIYMVMALEHYVDAQLLKDGAQASTELHNVALGNMACHGIHRLMETYHIPVGIGVLLQSLLQKFFVLGNGQVGGVQHHKLHTTIGEAVVAVAFLVLAV